VTPGDIALLALFGVAQMGQASSCSPPGSAPIPAADAEEITMLEGHCGADPGVARFQ
jgi:hypothetical protein